jgi:hypothetical protein
MRSIRRELMATGEKVRKRRIGGVPVEPVDLPAMAGSVPRSMPSIRLVRRGGLLMP